MNSTQLTFKLIPALALFASISAVQAQTGDVPAKYAGTYDLVVDFADSTTYPSLPHKKGDTIRIVIDDVNDSLCVNGTLVPGKPTGNPAGDFYLWVTANKTFYEVIFVNGQLHEVNLSQGLAGNFAGQLLGTKTSSSTVCGSSTTTPTTPTISSDVQTIFDLAAVVYPAWFKNGSELGLFQGYVYKYFATSGIYVGVKDNTIYVLGGPFGNSITNVGTVASVLSALKASAPK
jgi:hypothetical protein